MLKRDFLNEVNTCPWLKNCGTDVERAYNFDVYAITDIKDVCKRLNSLEWENFCLDRRNDLTSFLFRNYRKDYGNWNNTVRLVKKEYIISISDSVMQVLQQREWPNSMVDDISFNLLCIFMANNYSELYSDVFWDRMLNVYLSGHLPCGWVGNYPEGKLIVF